MSYILDALRRADAQRQRGAVPGLHDQPATLGLPAAAPAPRSVPLTWVLLALAGLLLLGLAGWWHQAGQPRTASAPGVAAALPAPAPVAASAVVALAPPVVAVAPPAPAPAVPVAPRAGEHAAPAAPAAVSSTGTTTVTVTVNGPAAAAAPKVAVVAAPAAAAAPAPVPTPPAAPDASPVAGAAMPTAAARLRADTAVPPLASLPEALRRQLPPLALGGGMYADQPSQRLVLVNGQVAHEGDDLGRGLRLVQIRPRSVVFGFGEQLFELAL